MSPILDKALLITGLVAGLACLSLVLSMIRIHKRGQLSGVDGGVGVAAAIILFLISAICLAISWATPAQAMPTMLAKMPVAENARLPVVIEYLIAISIIVLVLRVVLHLRRRGNGRINRNNGR